MLNVAACFVLAVVGPAPLRQPAVTMASLLAEMGRRDVLARLPEPAFKQLQASSYDRAETDPNDPKTWFANHDYEQFIRTESHERRTEWVIMEHQGPGAVTRIWTPLLKDKDKMVVRFYFDGSDKPGIEENFNDLMRGRGRIKPPFAFIAWPNPAVTDGVGSDLYFPIPYAKGCKITLSELPFYYSVDYRAFDAGTNVETFSWPLYDAIRETLESTGPRLGSDIVQPPSGGASHKIAAKGSYSADLPKGPMAITAIQVEVPAELDPQSLRSTVLEITLDGEQTVWCPIGDFFGCGITLKPVWDRYRTVTADGRLTCTWTMPYRSAASVRLRNLGSTEIQAKLRVRTDSWTWNDRCMYFHATWRHQFPLATRPMSDWNYVEATGQGVYVGDTLTVMNPSPAWYGEGDEQVYVDGEKFPSQLGTGTEDYYGYAWGMAEHWSSPFMAMPERDRKGRDNWLGYTTTSRVRGLDGIPFNSSLKFDMEIWHWADCKVEYSAAAFWYARPGATSNRPPAPDEAAKPLPEVGGTIKGALECESMVVTKKSDGVQVSTQTGGLTDGFWSSGEQLFLQAHAVGDFVELRVPNTAAGKPHVVLYATKSFDYGTLRFSVNGQVAKEVDLYSAKPVASGPIDLGEFDLSGKDAILRAEVTGTNPASTGDHYYFGLDCVVLANSPN